MTETYLTVISNRTGNAERLKTYTDFFGSLSSGLNLIFECDSTTYNISPSSVFKADRLNAFNDIVSVNTGFVANFFSLFNGGNTVFCEFCVNLIYSSVLTFK